MQRSNSAPDLEVSDTDFTSSFFENGNLHKEDQPQKGKAKRKKQISALTVTSGTSTELDQLERFDEDVEDADDHEEGGNGCGRGIVKDIKRTLGTHWVKEMTNFNQQTIAVSFFIFFAAIAPAISK
jgi:predicted adenine nucleotide alpha hydrolase (AANH) superfamily ATPase